MAPRVTDTEVKQIIETDLDVNPFINTATIIVDEDLVDQGFSAVRLREIELYLAAHFTTLRERQLESEEFGDAKDEFLGKVGKGLDASIYGQQAKSLDTSGILTDQGKAKARFEVFG